MSIDKALNILARKKLVITLGVLLGVVLSMFGTFFMDLEYKTEASFIVIQEQRFSDSFTQAKSAEYLAGILSQIVDTDSFRALVLKNAPKIAGILPQNELDLRKEWSRSVKARPLQDSGIIAITAYDKDARASDLILNAVGGSLTSNSAKYLGDTANIKLVKIDGPITSEFPVRPNMALNVLAGALIGGMLFSTILLVRGRGGQSSNSRAAEPRELKRTRRDLQTKGDLGALIKATRALSTKL